MTPPPKAVRIACQGATAIPLDRLEPYQGDLKTLTETDYKRLRKEIEELGFSEPISAWSTPIAGTKPTKYWILNGHQRRLTLIRMRGEGYQVPPIPVSWVDAGTPEEAKRKVLSLTSQFGTVTEEGIARFSNEAGLKLEDVARDFRFPDIDMDKMIKRLQGDEAKPVPVGAPPHKPTTRRGDVYVLEGEKVTHRLLCGDATNTQDWKRLMQGAKADLVHTDPPYGVSYEGKGPNARAIAGAYNFPADFDKMKKTLGGRA